MNMIQNAKDQVLDLTVSAYQKAAAEGLLPQDAAVTPSVEIPKDTANGDYTTTFCLAAAKALKKNPRQVAQILMDHMDLSGPYFTSVEMAGPGFLNFKCASCDSAVFIYPDFSGEVRIFGITGVSVFQGVKTFIHSSSETFV